METRLKNFKLAPKNKVLVDGKQCRTCKDDQKVQIKEKAARVLPGKNKKANCVVALQNKKR